MCSAAEKSSVFPEDILRVAWRAVQVQRKYVRGSCEASDEGSGELAHEKGERLGEARCQLEEHAALREKGGRGG